jgi:hypothetical protein
MKVKDECGVMKVMMKVITDVTNTSAKSNQKCMVRKSNEK